MSPPYIPDRSHAVWLDFNPQAGREQAGRRPALVLSPRAYNDRTGLAIVCPITTKEKRYPFEIPLPDGLAVTGIILADHLRSIDWSSRHASYICQVPLGVVRTVAEKFCKLIR